jgi:hypothetical protein
VEELATPQSTEARWIDYNMRYCDDRRIVDEDGDWDDDIVEAVFVTRKKPGTHGVFWRKSGVSVITHTVASLTGCIFLVAAIVMR